MGRLLSLIRRLIHRPVLCPVCGGAIVDGCCYSLCPRDPRYYSAEQERADDEAYEALSDAELRSLVIADYHARGECDPWDTWDPEPEPEPESDVVRRVRLATAEHYVPFQPATVADDDIPF